MFTFPEVCTTNSAYKKSSLSNSIFKTRNLKIQLQIDRWLIRSTLNWLTQTFQFWYRSQILWIWGNASAKNSLCHLITKLASLCSVQIFRLFLLWVKKGGSKRVKWDDIISGLKCEVSWSFSRLLLHIYAPRQNSSNRGSHYWYQTNTRLWAQVMAIWLVKFPKKGYKITIIS